MPALLRNILAVIVGLVVCMAVNGFLIALSSSVIPLPEGINPNDAKSIADNIDRYEVKHFIFPFLAHGLGSLIGAYIAAQVAATHKMIFAVVIGVVHMIGGITMAFSSCLRLTLFDKPTFRRSKLRADTQRQGPR